MIDSGRKRISCPYLKGDSDHSKPCAHCAAKGLRCIAGPASGRTRTGPALDSLCYGKVHTIRKAFARTAQKGVSKRKRSLDNKETATKRDDHLESHKDQLFEAPSRADAWAGGRSTIDAGIQRSSTTNAKVVKNETFFIRTQFAHPILLNINENTSCQWCQDTGFGIFGLGPLLEVEVLDMKDGTGYVEIAGGYAGAGMESSRMCTECTMNRLEIAACLAHNIEDLSEIKRASNDTSDVMKYLMPGMAASAPFIWCSVCPGTALYTCCKPVSPDVQGLLGRKDSKSGCGLKLCKDCAEALVYDAGGDLDALVQSIEQEDPDGVSLRADVDLILRGGEVVRRMEWMFTLEPHLS